MDLFSLSCLSPHFRTCDGTLENSCFQIFEYSRLYERIVFRWIKEPFSIEYHVVCYGKQSAQALSPRDFKWSLISV